MDFPLVALLLGRVALLIGVLMATSLPWAMPALHAGGGGFETRGFLGLLGGVAVCTAVGLVLSALGRRATGRGLYRKEAMAVVGLSWLLASVLGATPYLFAGVARGFDAADEPIQMSVADALFESASGFSTTGATVLTQLEDPALVPRCILFWRSLTHFLGGLGIIVLFVAILEQGHSGKVLVQSEITGPSKDGKEARVRHAALTFASLYVALNAILTVILYAEGKLLGLEQLGWFEALCHAFGTMATGGFSTFNASLGHYDSAVIEYTVLVFMVIAGTNFGLLAAAAFGRPWDLFGDLEWRTYLAIIVGVTTLVIGFGLARGDFTPRNSEGSEVADALRYGSFQVVSIMTTTGYGTHDFETAGINSAGRCCWC